MAVWMWIFISFIILQRLIELLIAKRNEIWMKERGAIEVGSTHYKWFIILHISFFIVAVVEVFIRNLGEYPLSYYLLTVFIIAQIIRVWCIKTLGKFWNTKIIIIPTVALIKKGPYKYLKHPNYVIVAIELCVIPLLFGAYITAIVFPILHLLLLRIRIPSENKALKNKIMPI